MRQATKEDFKRGTYLFDQEGNEFVLRDLYHEGIWTTNKGNVLFVNDARFYTTKEGSS